ncbi:MAG: tetratricopeptide repeat protein [Candidatus Omnitrophica bacterium]|nr:tetratricopeptide repeat protein [Candidatus Omnitrophota bacterium]
MAKSLNKNMPGHLGYLVIIAVGAALLYFKTIFFGLSYFDDNVWIIDYQWFLKDIRNIFAVFSTRDLISQVFFRPLLSASFILDAQLGGSSPFIYHLTNLAVHVLNCVLLFEFFRKMGYENKLSFGAAAIFLAHPALASAVVWIPGRTDSLLGTFVILSLIFFIDYLEKRKIKLILWSSLLFFAALLVKETAIVLPIICIIYILLINKDKGIKWPVLLLGWGCVITAWFLMRFIALKAVKPIETVVLLKSFLENIPAFLSYLGKVVFPFNLSVHPVLEDISLLPGILVVCGIIFAVIVSRKKRINFIIFGLLWFILFVSPSLVLSFIAHEYRLYLPISGILIVFLELDFIKNLVTSRAGIRIYFVFLIFFSALTFIYSDNFKNRIFYWENAVKNSPHSALAHKNLGAMYYLEATENKRIKEETIMLDKAKAQYMQALDLNPSESMVHNNLALIYERLGDEIKAEAEYKKEISGNPRDANVYFNLGLLCNKQSKAYSAIEMWEKTIQLDQNFIMAYKYLAYINYNIGDFDSALNYKEELEKRNIFDPELWDALKKAGK